MNRSARIRTLKGTVLLIAAIILLRLFYIQVLDDTYKTNAANNVLRYMVQYPPRGEVYDRNGEFLVQSKEAYDLMVTPREVHDLDTLLMAAFWRSPSNNSAKSSPRPVDIRLTGPRSSSSNFPKRQN